MLRRDLRRLHHYSFLHFDESGPGQLFEPFHQLLDLLWRLDELHLQREMVGYLDEAARMDVMVCAEPGNSLQYRRSRHSAEEQVIQNGRVDRHSMPRRPLTEIDGDLDSSSGGQHISPCRNVRVTQLVFRCLH